jgi:diguanylate cyclase (GGDEF)-like protein
MLDLLSKPNAQELSRLFLFQSVNPDAIEEILPSCMIRRMKRQEILLTPGEPNNNLYQLLSGRLRVHLDSPDDEPIGYIEEGETVGEMSIIDNEVTSAYVVADTDSRLLVMDHELVWSLMDISHVSAYNLLRLLTSRLRHANDVIAEKIQLETPCFRYGSVDVPTGMHNRQWLDMILPRQLKRCTFAGSSFSVILIDIDFFRKYNEKYGRMGGDRAINTIAQIIMEHLRPTELAARYGGDQFFVILPEVDVKMARSIAERLRKQVMYANIIAVDGRKLPSLTISLGLAEARSGLTVEELFQTAEAALGRAKKMGKNYVSD